MLNPLCLGEEAFAAFSTVQIIELLCQGEMAVLSHCCSHRTHGEGSGPERQTCESRRHALAASGLSFAESPEIM